MKKRECSKTYRIKNNLIGDLKQIGDGDWKKGMYESVEAWKIMHKNPEMKLMHDVDVLMSDLRLYYPSNHYDHFDNFPAVFRMFLKRGSPDFSIMTGKRVEKSLEEYTEEDGGNNAE